MDHGRIVAEGSPRELIVKYVAREVVEIRSGDREYRALATALSGVAERFEILADRLCCYADDGEMVLAELERLGREDDRAYLRRASLEDVFLRLTGRTLVD
jgi:lipooligosaccharide transport system ATP-binding protein